MLHQPSSSFALYEQSIPEQGFKENFTDSRIVWDKWILYYRFREQACHNSDALDIACKGQIRIRLEKKVQLGVKINPDDCA